jgi:hypothetical protein
MTRTDAPPADSSDPLARLLAAVPPGLRSLARDLLTHPSHGGRGLRAWLAMLDVLDADDRPMPRHLPGELVEVYLHDDEAEPLHDCERCGLPVPVRAARRCGHEAAVEREYFPACPHCGGRTGRHAYWSRRTLVAAN